MVVLCYKSSCPGLTRASITWRRAMDRRVKPGDDDQGKSRTFQQRIELGVAHRLDLVLAAIGLVVAVDADAELPERAAVDLVGREA
ncbi:hypothetical protein ACQR1Y_12230 [Bradyrhizobium sp. HKCCYLRH3099]|uniref:hypothetical protein n=1 Tax=unclassified Bradyrhizobium TaxID=2631580 RepID=UPI003EB9CAAF